MPPCVFPILSEGDASGTWLGALATVHRWHYPDTSVRETPRNRTALVQRTLQANRVDASDEFGLVLTCAFVAGSGGVKQKWVESSCVVISCGCVAFTLRWCGRDGAWHVTVLQTWWWLMIGWCSRALSVAQARSMHLATDAHVTDILWRHFENGGSCPIWVEGLFSVSGVWAAVMIFLATRDKMVEQA